jgi:hypothetical protein
MASHFFEQETADPNDFGIELGLDFALRVYEDDESGNYADFERVPRLYVNGKVYDLPQELQKKLEDIISEFYEGIDYQ